MEDNQSCPIEDEEQEYDDPNQLALFDIPCDWESEWQGMPEFVMKDLTPFRTVYMHFRNKNDIANFAQLIDQRITLETKSLWYPQLQIDVVNNMRYEDESEISSIHNIEGAMGAKINE